MNPGAGSLTVRRSDRPTYHLIPHTHWDREWYLPLAVFQARLVPVLDAALEMLDRDATQRLTLDGQTVLLEDYLAFRPDAADRIADHVARGALDIGPWYVLADELIPSGESLVRNLLEGTADAVRLGGRSEVLYSPDAFGHPAVLPALAREFGLTSGALWRGMGNPAGTDRDLYRWIAPDGGELLVYHLPPEGYEVGIGVAHDRATWPALRDQLAARSVTNEVGVFVGADHHAIADLSDLPETDPDARISTLSEFMRALTGAPTFEVRGELRNAGHTLVLQGVHGTRSRMKRRHGIAELGLARVAEPLAAMATLQGGANQTPLLRRAWRTLLQSQFHDTIGGCSVDAVAETQERRLADVQALWHEIAARSLDSVVGHDPDATRDRPGRSADALVLWNPATRRRDAIVTAELALFRQDVPVGPPSGVAPRQGPGYEPFTLVDGTSTIPVQVLAVRRGMVRVDSRRLAPDQDEVDRVWVAFGSPGLSGLGTRVVAVRRGTDPVLDHGLTVSRGRLANRLVELRISSTGAIELTDLRNGERYGALGALEDEPDAGDTYTFSRGSGPLSRGGMPLSRSILASGPLVGAVETRWRLHASPGGVIEVRQVVVLHADAALVRIRLEVTNAASDHRVRARFPVGAGHEAVAGAAFSTERRAAVWRDTPAGLIEHPVLTAPAQRYVAAADGTRGLAVFAPGFFEFEWTEDQDLLVTLVRSVGELSRADLSERPGHAGWPEPVPLAQEPGTHRIDLALAPITDDAVNRPQDLEHHWEDAFLPAQCRYYGKFAGAAGPRGGIALQGDGLVSSAIKPGADGGIVLRCWNAQGTAVKGRWVSGEPLAKAMLLRADETEVNELPITENCAIDFVAGPCAIVTIWVRR